MPFLLFERLPRNYFAVIVLDVRRDSLSQMTFAQWDQAVEAFLFDGAHESFGVGVRIGCLIRYLYDPDPRLAQSGARRRAPLRIPIADEDAMLDQEPNIRSRHREHDLLHEDLVRMGVDPTICTRREARSITNTV
jgi:hypothetical protein